VPWFFGWISKLAAQSQKYEDVPVNVEFYSEVRWQATSSA